MPLDNTLDAIDASVATLASFIKSNICDLVVIDEWPYGNQAITMPSLTIQQVSNTRTPEMPWFVSQTAPDANGLITVNEVTANYDTTLQLDLWTKNKLDRKKYLSLILALFNSQQSQTLAPLPTSVTLPDGLSLLMPDYFNEYARFEIVSHEHRDDEQAAQRQERREKIEVLLNVREIRQRSYYAIKQIQAFVGTGENQTESGPIDQVDLEF